MSTRGFQDVPPVFEGDPDADPTTGAAPTGDQSKPTVTSLGNGYSLVTWTTQEYDPQIGAVGPKTHSQIVADKDAASVAAVEAAKIGAGAAGLSASISTAGANQRAAVQAEIDRARNAADAAHQQAMDALASGNAAEAKRQFDISQSELTRSHDLDASIRQQEADLGKQKFGFDVYNKLSDLASNPRNYMEQFFRLRGSPPPANAAQYGNGGQQGIVPFEQFLPNFLRSTFGASSSSGQTGAVGAPPSAAPASPALSGPSGASTAGLSGFDAATGKPRLSPTDPDALGLMASHPGMYTMTSPQAAQPYIDQLKKEGNDATVYASSYRQPQQFADGGTLRMTAPHAIVNLLTGRVAAIAGEQPGNGPQGYVPETAKFDGQAIIDPKAPTGATDPFNSDPTGAQSTLDPNAPAPTDPFVAQNLKTPGGLAYPADTTTAPLDTAAGHDNVYVQPTPTETNMPQPLPPGPAPLPFNITSQPAPPGFHWQNGVLVQDAAVTPPPPIPPVTPPQPPITPPVTPPTPPVTPPVTPPTGGAVPPPTVTPPGVTPPTTPPNPTPSFLSSLQALAHTPSGLGKNPTFLPEDAAQKNPIVKTLMDNGAFAPFLQRLYAQNAGLAGLGTNVPQQTDLPAGVPLASRLYLSQLNPSELAAFQSFISAQGLDWNDYLSLVDAASPQGGASTSSNVSYPKFLGQ